jgi:ribosomal peptide maturation radical SAM protein 1
MADSSKGTSLRVALVNMPFSSARFPSIQIGLLQSILLQRGIPTTAHYLNLEFAARIGWKRYDELSDSTLCFLGDWLFSKTAFRDAAPDGRLFLQRFGRRLGRAGAEWLWRQREEVVPAFLEDCVASVPWHHYDVVGFSSVFVQNCAALALSRRLKERHPKLINVFGGANFEDEMGLEYVRALPWIDYSVLGEADETFPALLDRLADGGEVVALPGIARRVGGRVEYGGPPPLVKDLDKLPVPTYDDFFATGARLRLPSALTSNAIQLPYESARGCWWGEKHHCTFCGLNGLTMGYRSKSPARILEEIEELAHRYRTRYLGAVDNILDHQHIDGVFGVLAEQKTNYRFFYEIKANLRREQVRMLARGGIWRVQPGIESLSTHLLQLMRKGISAIKNLRLLKWATYYGIKVSWNILLGFPGECEEDYEEQVRLIKTIPHFPPPIRASRISLERFSPNYTQAAQIGFENVRPIEPYSYIYPPEVDKRRIAYFFEYDAPGTLPDAAYVLLRNEVKGWQNRWRETARPYLTYAVDDEHLTVFDGRQPGSSHSHEFEAPAARVYEFCSSTDRSAANILAHLRQSNPQVDNGSVERILDRFSSLGLMYEEDGNFLSLALPKQPGL